MDVEVMNMTLHIILDEKFTDGFISFINENFNQNVHKFLVIAPRKTMKYCKILDQFSNVVVIHKKLSDMIRLVKECIMADKIIVHSLMIKYIQNLFGFKMFARKTYIALWGGEIYEEKNTIRDYLKHRILSKVKGIICELEEDYLLTKKKYATRAPYFPCMMYLSNVVEDDDFEEYRNKKEKKKQTVMIGNSADPENNHKEIIDRLALLEEEAEFILPLSYGDKEYAQLVSAYAKKKLNGSVHILSKFISVNEYLNILKSVDIVVYAHRRQQALGNTFHLLTYGAKLYLNSETTTYAWMKRNGIQVFSSSEIGNEFYTPLSSEDMKNNSVILSAFVSRDVLKKIWQAVFED